MGKLDKITCQAFTQKSIKEGKPVRCKCLGRFIPNSKRFLCSNHNGHRSWSFMTGQYKGLYRNENLPMLNKIKVLKNLKNFKGKSDDEIQKYIEKKQRLAFDKNFRSEFYLRSYRSFKNFGQSGHGDYRGGDSKRLTDQFEQVLQNYKSRRKV